MPDNGPAFQLDPTTVRGIRLGETWHQIAPGTLTIGVLTIGAKHDYGYRFADDLGRIYCGPLSAITSYLVS